jgi:hypothetical protein
LVVWEDWNLYALRDSRILKIKSPVSRINIKENEHNPGSVHYEVDFDFIIKVEGEIDLQKPSEDPTIKQEDIVQEIDFELVQARPQIYYMDELRQILITRPSIQKIFSTTKYDTKGFPIYKCDFSIAVTTIKTP